MAHLGLVTTTSPMNRGLKEYIWAGFNGNQIGYNHFPDE